MKTLNINFVALTTAPNPQEVSYWVDLTADPSGGIIKYYPSDSNGWVISTTPIIHLYHRGTTPITTEEEAKNIYNLVKSLCVDKKLSCEIRLCQIGSDNRIYLILYPVQIFFNSSDLNITYRSYIVNVNSNGLIKITTVSN